MPDFHQVQPPREGWEAPNIENEMYEVYATIRNY